MELSFSNIFRYKKKSLITIMLMLLLIVLTNVYLKNIESNIRQLDHLKDAVPVYCQVTNMNGTRESGLAVPYEMLKSLEESRSIEKLAYTVRLMAGVGDFPEEEWSRYLNLNIMSSNVLDQLIGSEMEEAEFSKREQEDFVKTAEGKCLVNQSVMENRKWKIGDVIDLKLYYYLYDDREGIMLLPLDCVPVEIIGRIPQEAGITQGMPLDIVLPIQFVRNEYKKADMDFMADSASFYVKDPLKLNEFKEEMRSYHFQQQNADAFDSCSGNALSVRDETFISLAENLQQTISLLKTCFLPVCIGVMVIGYFVSYLLMRGRQKEFLLMRAMGMKVRQCVGVYLLEQAFLCLAGAGIGCVLCISGSGWKTTVCTALAVFGFYLFGACAALWRFSGKNMIQLLYMKE